VFRDVSRRAATVSVGGEAAAVGWGPFGGSVPYTPYTWYEGAPGVWSGSQTFTAASPDSRGAQRPIWEMIYNHYANRQGLSVPSIAAYAASMRPEGGGGDYGGASGGFDQLGHGTLAYTI